MRVRPALRVCMLLGGHKPEAAGAAHPRQVWVGLQRVAQGRRQETHKQHQLLVRCLRLSLQIIR